MKKCFSVLLCMVFLSVNVCALENATFYMNDGTVITGSYYNSGKTKYFVEKDGKWQVVRKDQVSAMRVNEEISPVKTETEAPAETEARPVTNDDNKTNQYERKTASKNKATAWIVTGIICMVGGYFAYSEGNNKIKSSEDSGKKGLSYIDDAQYYAFLSGEEYNFWYYTDDASSYYWANYYAHQSESKRNEAKTYYEKQRDEYSTGQVYQYSGYALMGLGAISLVKGLVMKSNHKKEVALSLNITNTYAGLMYKKKFSI